MTVLILLSHGHKSLEQLKEMDDMCTSIFHSCPVVHVQHHITQFEYLCLNFLPGIPSKPLISNVIGGHTAGIKRLDTA